LETAIAVNYKSGLYLRRLWPDHFFRTPCACGKALRGGFRQAMIYSNKKGFTFGDTLHFTLLKQAN
jgi:hypothetical protein